MADPADVSGLLHRWRADSITGVANGAGVATWPALAGGVALAQTTAGNRPTYLTSGIGGQPSVRFTSANLQRFTATITARNQPLTYVLVHKLNRTTTGSDQQLLHHDIQILTVSPSNVYDLYAGTDLLRGPLSSDPVVLTAVANTTASRIVLNGTQSGATGTMGTGNGNTDLWIGARPDSVQHLDADVAEILVYSGVKTDAELATVHSYVQDRYGIAVADYVPSTINYSGSLALTGDGPGLDVTVGGLTVVRGPLALTGSGTVGLNPASVATSGSLSLSGTGGLAHPAGRLAVNGSLTLNGSGTLAWTGRPGWTATLLLGADGQMALSGAKYGFRGAPLALGGSGSLALAVQRLTVGTVAVPLGGSSALGLQATRIVVPKTGSIAVPLSGGSALVIPAGAPGFTDVVGLSGGSGLTRQVVLNLNGGSLAFSGVGSLDLNDPLAIPVYVFTHEGTWRPIKAIRAWNGRTWLVVPSDRLHIY